MSEQGMTRRELLKTTGLACGGVVLADGLRGVAEAAPASQSGAAGEKPNIILIMTDDQGWGEVGYYDHPVLKTPNLDAMAANGLRLDRFYAGAPVCSPTRASVLTGRSNDRAGVFSHGFPLRRQEKTISAASQDRSMSMIIPWGESTIWVRAPSGVGGERMWRPPPGRKPSHEAV